MSKKTVIDNNIAFQTVMNTLLDGLIIINKKGIVQNFNPAAGRIFGYKLEEVVGQNVKMLMPDPYHIEHNYYLSNYLKTGDAKIIGAGRKVSAKRKDGSIFPMELVINEMELAGELLFVCTMRDISDYKKAKKNIQSKNNELTESHTLHKMLIESIADCAIITLTLEGLVSSWNAGAQKIKGYKENEILGKHFSVFYPKKDRNNNVPTQILKTVLKKGKYETENVMLRQDGKIFWANLIIDRLNNQDGNIIGFVKITQDITKRKEAELKLKQEAKKIQSIVDNTVDGMITIDDRGNIESFNLACEKIFGYGVDEVIGKNVKMLMPEPYHKEHDSYLKNYYNTGEKKIIGIGREVAGKRKDGSTFPVDLSVSEIVLDNRKIYSGIVRDISERKKAELELQQTTAKIKAIVDNTVDGMITIDDRGNIESFNLACEKIFGYGADEVIGKNVKMLMPDPYHKEHDGYLKNYRDTRKKKIIGIGREVEGKRKDGSIFPVDLSVSEVVAEGKRIFSGIVRDITELKEAQQRIQEFVTALKHSNQELDDFAYIASHDLKEPLRGLSNNAIFLKEDYDDKLDESGKKRLDRITYLCERMEHLVDDLLYFSRLGRQELAIQDTNLNTIIKDIEFMMETTINEQNASIYIPKPLPDNIICDVPRITELFRNLITNAVKYNDSDAKTIEIGMVDANKCNNEDVKSSDYVFYVSDNGIGIEEVFYEDVFRIFKRLNAEDDTVKGTGVGLTFVKKIVERHGGVIWIEPNKPNGTIFYFSIPKNIGEKHD